MPDRAVDPWPRVDASSWTLAGEEPGGLHEHPWLSRDPADRNQRTWLFKASPPDPDRPLPEDVIEKLASEIAAALGVPAARVELGVRHGTPGCLVEDLRPSGWERQYGQVLIDAVVENYDSRNPAHRGYSVATIRAVLGEYAAPPDFAGPGGFEAFDIFAGLLIFDALIANTDRHDRNWLVLIPPSPQPVALCGSFDHASSLGFNLSDAERTQRLREGTVEQWASRAPARQFEHVRGAPRRHLIDVAREAFVLCPDPVRSYWRNAVVALDEGRIRSIISHAPDLTDVTRRFTTDLLTINRRRLLDVLD